MPVQPCFLALIILLSLWPHAHAVLSVSNAFLQLSSWQNCNLLLAIEPLLNAVHSLGPIRTPAGRQYTYREPCCRDLVSFLRSTREDGWLLFVPATWLWLKFAVCCHSEFDFLKERQWWCCAAQQKSLLELSATRKGHIRKWQMAWHQLSAELVSAFWWLSFSCLLLHKWTIWILKFTALTSLFIWHSDHSPIFP